MGGQATEEQWLFQLRVYLPDELAEAARHDSAQPTLRALIEILQRHDATLVSQLGAFESYVAEAEREGPEGYPLYRWTKATVDDPGKRAKHIRTFSLWVGGEQVYPRAAADALEAALRPLVGGAVVTSMSRHDTNPANNLQVPPAYRS